MIDSLKIEKENYSSGLLETQDQEGKKSPKNISMEHVVGGEETTGVCP